MNELIYSTIDFLILKGQYYLTVYNNEERALRFFRRAETIALDAYDYLNPSLLKSLVKTRLLFSKMLIKNNEFKKSLKLLWKNINTLKLECSIRMGKEMGAMKPNDQKMKKWCKYFIMNLHQMIFCYTQLGEVSAANETGIMMEWLAEGFFENKSLFFLNVADFSHHLKETSRYYIRMKANTEYHFMNIIEKYFHPELFEKFLKKRKNKNRNWVYS